MLGSCICDMSPSCENLPVEAWAFRFVKFDKIFFQSIEYNSLNISLYTLRSTYICVQREYAWICKTNEQGERIEEMESDWRLQTDVLTTDHGQTVGRIRADVLHRA